MLTDPCSTGVFGVSVAVQIHKLRQKTTRNFLPAFTLQAVWRMCRSVLTVGGTAKAAKDAFYLLCYCLSKHYTALMSYHGWLTLTRQN